MTQICYWCDETITEHDRRAPDRLQAHWECGLRAVVGGLNHLNGACSCCGGSLPPDPAGLTRREAARMAAQAWVARMKPPTYVVHENGRAIRCLICQHTSWNIGDVVHRYCGFCRRYHDDGPPPDKMRP